MSSFIHVALFVFPVWPVVCYAVQAATEKLVKELSLDRPRLADAMYGVVTWIMLLGVLSSAAHARWTNRPDIATEYAYVGGVLWYEVFNVPGWPDRDRLVTVAVVYVGVVCAWSDDLLLAYAVAFAFFRSLHTAWPRVRELSYDVLPNLDARVVRVVEVAVLGAMCVRYIWISDKINHPLVLGLNAATACGYRFDAFITKKHKTH